MNWTSHWIFNTEVNRELESPPVYLSSYLISFMIQTVTKFDMQISISLILGSIFLLIGLYLVSNNNIESNKYQRWDYGGLLFFYISIMFIFFLTKFWYFEWFWYIGSIQKPLFLGMIFLSLGLLWSWIINIHFRKKITSDTAYKFWVSSFISWWIIIFYLIAESLR